MADPRPDTPDPDPTEPDLDSTGSDSDSQPDSDDARADDVVPEVDEDAEAEDGGSPRSRRAERRAARAAEDQGQDQHQDDAAAAVAADPDPTPRARPSLPLVPVLAGLLVLLVAATAYLFLTRPDPSPVRTDDYVDALQAARAGIVDVASFDHLTLDDDIQQIRSVTTGDLQEESVGQLDARRQEITDAQAVVNTEVVGAAVGAADEDSATVFMVIQSTQRSNASEQTQVQRYRIEVDLTKDGDRWLLSGITGR